MQMSKSRKKTEELEKALAQKQEDKEKSPYMSKGIYKNYAKGMKEKNQKRIEQGLKAIPIRTFEEWSN